MTLQEFKEATGKTDAQLADEIGIDRSYLVKLRNGTSTPSIEILAAIRRATKGAVNGDEWLQQRGDK